VPETSVAVADVTTGTGLRMLTCAEPDVDGEATLTAVTVTGLVAGRLPGGVYSPVELIVPTLLFPPAIPPTCHVTAVFVRLTTVAVKLMVLPRRT
jgi:hypothetical protein